MHTEDDKPSKREMMALMTLQDKFSSVFLSRFRLEIKTCIERLRYLEAIHSRPPSNVKIPVPGHGVIEQASDELLGVLTSTKGSQSTTIPGGDKLDSLVESYYSMMKKAREEMDRCEATWFRKESLRNCVSLPSSLMEVDASYLFGDSPKITRLNFKDSKVPVWKEFYDWLCLTDKAAIPSDRNEEEPIAVDNGNDSDDSSDRNEEKPIAVDNNNDSDVSITIEAAAMAPEGKPHAVPQDTSIRSSITQPMEEETSGPLPPENTKTADDTGNDNAQPMETDEDSDNGMSEPMEEEASTPPLDGDTNYTEEREKKGLTKPPATTCRHQWQEERRN